MPRTVISVRLNFLITYFGAIPLRARLASAGPCTFTYDANGNLATKVGPSGTITHTWDTQNKLASVLVGAWEYQHIYYLGGEGDRKMGMPEFRRNWFCTAR